jgi:hypothetical protein
MKEWRNTNKQKCNDYRRLKYKNDPMYKLKYTLRHRLNKYLKYKKCSLRDYIGCSMEDLKKYIENQFKDGMSWENHGLYGWHIDHIIPISSAKTEEEIYKLCHYTNLQPLWAIENLQKGDRICPS